MRARIWRTHSPSVQRLYPELRGHSRAFQPSSESTKHFPVLYQLDRSVCSVHPHLHSPGTGRRRLRVRFTVPWAGSSSQWFLLYWVISSEKLRGYVWAGSAWILSSFSLAYGSASASRTWNWEGLILSFSKWPWAKPGELFSQYEVETLALGRSRT